MHLSTRGFVPTCADPLSRTPSIVASLTAGSIEGPLVVPSEACQKSWAFRARSTKFNDHQPHPSPLCLVFFALFVCCCRRLAARLAARLRPTGRNAPVYFARPNSLGRHSMVVESHSNCHSIGTFAALSLALCCCTRRCQRGLPRRSARVKYKSIFHCDFSCPVMHHHFLLQPWRLIFC